MTLDDVLRELIGCLGARDDCVIGWEHVRRWPKGALEGFQKAGWLKSTIPATAIECSGCEENCFMPIQFSPAPPGQTAAAHVACEKRSEMGMVRIPPARLQQWQLSHAQVVRWASTALHLRGKPETDAASATFTLGHIQGKQRLADVHLDFNEPVSLKVSGHVLPLIESVFMSDGQPNIDQAAIVAMADLLPLRVPKRKKAGERRMSLKVDQEVLEVGTRQWREQTARKAANTLHSRPGGSRDKQQRICQIWATGKYSSRDRCADEECEALGMSYSTARKALRNTPDP